VDGFDKLEETLSGLGVEARPSLHFYADPAGTRVTFPPLKSLRRDESLEAQALAHLASLDAPSGDYEVRMRVAGGRYVGQFTRAFRIRPAGGPVVAPPVAPAVEPSAGGGGPAGGPAGGHPLQAMFDRMLARQMERIEEQLAGDGDAGDDDDEDAPDEGTAAESRLLALAEKAMESPVLSGPLSMVLEAGADWLKQRARLLGARASKEEARAERQQGKTGAAAAPLSVVGGGTGLGGVSRLGVGRVVGFSRKPTGGGGGGGDGTSASS
jgi:hypothetical protein